jgi:phage terminase large subunit-like protein
MDVLDELGIPVTKFHTNQASRMVPACQEFFDAVTEGRLTHDGDPVLARHLDNAVIKSDRFGRRITKESGNSPRKIDAAVAAVVAHSRAIGRLDVTEQPTPSILIL